MVSSEKPMLKKNQKRLLFTKLPLMAFSVLMVIFIIFNLYIKNPFQHSSNVQNYPSTKRFSLLIGILTRADKHEHRHFLRLIYGIQSSPLAQIDLKFVFCNLTKQEQRVLISLEIIKFNDIIILNCSENMNDGKTYTYFSSLPNILSHPYDYVMKADDDVYFRLLPLASSLQPLPRSDLYYGFVIPCQMEWIANSDIPRNNTIGPEDKLVGKWLNLGKKARNRVSNKPAMYDYPGINGRCSHELIPETIAVHKLKRWDQWLDVIRYFNVTKDLNTSKLYNGLNFDSVFNLKM
ncbi:unnamed protein product [Lactuca saligna]|uniref:Hexosyltransferase n=1 Tax=Lactuca saligna TaxID=75948 RepID=A0AA36E177_LACSI|nr:unnamed protein product [Lactuca saligna]